LLFTFYEETLDKGLEKGFLTNLRKDPVRSFLLNNPFPPMFDPSSPLTVGFSNSHSFVSRA
jgi:hypothetical protein